MTNQEKVLEFISERDTTSLIFKKVVNEWEIIKINAEDLTLNEVVELVLDYSSEYSSYNLMSHSRETLSNKWRSSLDIYRHTKYFIPEVTIFDVMNSLYEIKDILVGHYCGDIKRRVFKLEKNTSYCSLHTDGTSYYDEYGLTFENWKGINK